MYNKFSCLLFTCVLALSASQSFSQNKIDLQGHRGARGLMPENTIPAMKKAIDLGVNLEMDINFSKDQKPIVSHDHWLNAAFVLTPDGKEIPAETQKEKRLYDLKYKEIRKYDVGSKFYSTFPEQKKMKAYIPLLSELIDSVELYAKQKNYPLPHYNIETKISETGDNINHPTPKVFVKKLMKVINSKKIADRVMIQSFDPRTLEIINKQHKNVQTSYLVSKGKLEDNLKKLTFKPDIYSPNYKMVNKSLVEKCHQMGIKVIPWTVNTKEEIEAIKATGVDGIISDYPNLY
ncbi:glycerophosphoryl diester phosphodiesterase [Pseudopedobacter saltans DSM 12145]|uniref:Glycerophosphoryl diester phosphodiesterase n=1 Tax=Pseudopedobacter saltans (strain ATCC 51119 / DSM 12145 / JCM 21818 / CCUG 39354 / LMG 10337 / NBRC 100064 / NCIMB 13643) TaxID=762903 RepID=F0S8G3_PSESL|nr:glycerophosphodiester phosphodiesterase [Pseudopedobacter saltans]ADY53427.1 glycerophosphoryl diester phosphodiesterase [Pseudopedobacter saltans DSM 12145]